MGPRDSAVVGACRLWQWLMGQGFYDQCVGDCEKAIQVGRSNMADYKLVMLLPPASPRVRRLLFADGVSSCRSSSSLVVVVACC